MKQLLRTLTLGAALATSLGVSTVFAQNGEPHTLTASALFDKVTLNWKKPTDAITLQWHDGEDYNGKDGVLSNPEGAVTFYAGAKFTAAELANYVGQTVESVSLFEYRPIYRATVVIFENGKAVAEQPVDMSNFKKNSWRKATMQHPYTIKAGVDVIFAIKYEYGRNLDLTAICDRAATQGKGNLYSYDGKTWKTDAPGDFLITVGLKNNATADPTGYNVYRNDARVNSEPLAADATSYVISGEPDGTYAYKVAAVYADGEKASYAVNASTKSVYNQVPPVSYAKNSSDGLTNTLTWTAPLARSSEMTWTNKQYGLSIGGTAAKNTKVWIMQIFDAADMAAFPNHQIKAINAYVGPEGGITGVTAWVMKDGVIVYSEEVSSDAVAAIKANDWNKFTLTTPYKMELGSVYAFGLYYTQTPKLHPVGVDTGTAVDSKGNYFSVSSPSSKGFNLSKPSWKTLSSGKISGNLMLTADVEALSDEAAASQTVASYKVYREGTLVADNVKETNYVDKVDDLGLYHYDIVACSADGKTSEPYSLVARASLPAEYTAPLIIGKSQEGKNVKLEWSSNAYEMQKYVKATNVTGFPEEMSVLYGAKFTKEELKPYVGFKLYSMKFGIYANIGNFKMEVRDGNNKVLLSRSYTPSDIEPGYIYNTTFEDGESCTIPADQDLYICYNATLPANVAAILFDDGPAVEGGAMISLTDGAKWMKFGSLATAVKNYNLVIGAMAVAPVEGQKSAKAAVLTPESINTTEILRCEVGTVRLDAIQLEEGGLGVEADRPMRAQAEDAKPQVKAFRVYCNGEQVYEGLNTSYSTTLNKYGSYQYYVTAVYANGWESPASDVSTFDNLISQKLQAPYDLKATTDGSTLKLTWKAGDTAPEYTYQHDGKDMVIGMTKSSGNLEGYHAIKFKAADMADKVGQKVSRIKFKLATNDILSASVFVMYGENIMAEQTVPVSSIVAGWNTVVLNTPVEVVSGQDISVGYHITYAQKIKPIVMDVEPAVAGYSDLISSSATPGYWYSLATKYKINYNYRISAVFESDDQELQPQKQQRALVLTGYNVYHDGVKVNKSKIGTTEYSIPNAAYGEYTVTAVDLSSESSKSNKVVYSETTDITLPTTTRATDGKVYSIDGRQVSSNARTEGLQKGVYVTNGKKVIVK